jgi:hypothetical protein
MVPHELVRSKNGGKIVMQAKNMKWAVFSGFLALLLIVAGVLAFGGSVRAAYPASVAAQSGGGSASKSASNAPSGLSCQTYNEIEPNNTISNATNIPAPQQARINGSITPAGDQDYFSFGASAGSRVWGYVVTNESAPSTDSILTLMNVNTNTLQLDDDNGFQSTLSSAIAGAPITQTGTYVWQMRQFGGATVMSQYYIYMDQTFGPPIEEIEPNDTITQTNPYTFGTVVSGTIPISTDLDLYTFPLTAGDQIVIQVDGDPDKNGINLNRFNQFNPNFDLLDSAGALITAVDSDSQGGNGGHLSESYVYTSTTTANFIVRVKFDPSTPGEDDLGQYQLHIYKVNCPGGANTATVTPLPTNTPVPPTATNTALPTNTTAPATATNTAAPTNTTAPATATNTVQPTTTSTPVASSTVAGATNTPGATATVCTINFPDNQPGDTFYEYIQCLACRHIVTGFPDGLFHAERNITRGQISKMVSNSAGFFEDPGPQIYDDVPPGSPYYDYINRLTNRDIMSGYPCPDRPSGGCSPDNPVIFLPNANATRGQLAKIVSNAAGFDEAVSGQFYADVPESGEGSQFYEWIMRLTNRGVMSGYPCGGPGEDCDAQNRPYFRWSAWVTRGQASKIDANTFFPNCEERVD